MTTSAKLKQRLNEGNLYKFGGTDSVMTGQDNSYVRPWGNCHPDFYEIPIGHPDGVKMCVRRTDQCGRQIGDTLQMAAKANIENHQGYFRACPQLYDDAKEPSRVWNPLYYSDRFILYQDDLTRDDYLHQEVKFDGTGIKLNRPVSEGRDAGHEYYKYYYDHTPVDDFETGMRTTGMSDNMPTPKYDITRLHQSYPLWKNAQAWHGRGNAANIYDSRQFERII
jgi:hypothetical protein